MMPLFDLMTVIITVLLMVVSMQPPVVGIIQQGIQSVDLSQFEPVRALLKSGDDVAASTAYINILQQQDAIAHPLALIFSLLFALYVNKYVQLALYQIHLLVYEFSPMTVLWIVIENVFNFIYCTAFPWVIGWLTYKLFNSLLVSYCIDSTVNGSGSSSSAEPANDLLVLIQQWGSPAIAFVAILVGLATCAITSQYKSKRTEEIELLAIPPTLHSNNYNGSTSNNYSDRRGVGGGGGRDDRTVGR